MQNQRGHELYIRRPSVTYSYWIITIFDRAFQSDCMTVLDTLEHNLDLLC